MTIFEALTWANNKLKEHQDVDADTGSRLDAPMLDAQLLLASVLDVSKNYLFTHFAEELPETQLRQFDALVIRRVHHEPIAYILGWKEFFGRPLAVNPFVLIPRPETETLVSEATQLAGEGRDVLFIDVGTGSGAIAISLAAETGRPVIAVDISPRAITLAKKNARLHQVDDRVTFLAGNLLEPIERPMTKPVEHVIICANLPYLSTKQWANTQSEVHDYEPRLALDGGVDGLDIYNTLFHMIAERRDDFPNHLTVLFEIDPDQPLAAERLLKQHLPNGTCRVVQDLSEKPRVVIASIS